MIIETLRSERQQDRARIVATVQWEDSNRATEDIYFETQAEFAEDLTCNPHAFLTGCVVPALHHGEKRIFIDEEICPELRDGLMSGMELLRHWYYEPMRGLPRIEAKRRSRSLTSDRPARAGAFFSGGVDAWTTLRRNRLDFHPEHSAYIKDTLLVFGLFRDEPGNFKDVLNRTIKAARMMGTIPIPIWTNLVSLGQGWDFWGDEFEGAAFAAIAHAFANRLSVVSLASSYHIPLVHPHGSHPMLDPSYSSSDLRIKHDGICLSRLMKVKLLAEWDIALKELRVCNQTRFITPERLNCGQCEKCVRTMLALLAVGALGRAPVFPQQDVSANLVESAVYMDRTTSLFYGELLAPLNALGRRDLVLAIERKLSGYRRLERRQRVKDHIKKFDAEYLRGALIGTLKSIYPKPMSTSDI